MTLNTSLGSFMLPGESIGTLTEQSGNVKIVVGHGIKQKNYEMYSTRPGLLHFDIRRKKISIVANYKRYTPGLEDCVIAIVMEKHSEEYRLDINGTDTATLSAVAFQGATKKNKPTLQIGSVVFARVIRASKTMEAEVTCIEPGSSKSWGGGECTFGELKEGNLVNVSLEYARMLSKSGRSNRIFRLLGEKVPFESAVGTNGRLWVKASSVRETVALSIAFQKADILETDEWLETVELLFRDEMQT